MLKQRCWSSALSSSLWVERHRETWGNTLKSRPPKELKPLLQAVNTLKSLSALIFVKCVGPPMKCFSPRHCVKSWLQKKHIFASNLQTRACENKQQRHDYESIWSLLLTVYSDNWILIECLLFMFVKQNVTCVFGIFLFCFIVSFQHMVAHVMLVIFIL